MVKDKRTIIQGLSWARVQRGTLMEEAKCLSPGLPGYSEEMYGHVPGLTLE